MPETLAFYCSHGLAYNFCDECRLQIPIAVMKVMSPNELLQIVQERLSDENIELFTRTLKEGLAPNRQTIHDGDVMVTVQSQRPKRPASGRLMYHEVSKTVKFAHYLIPDDNYRIAGITMKRSWEPLSWSELSMLKTNIAWALARAKNPAGPPSHVPRELWMTKNERAVFNNLTIKMENTGPTRVFPNESSYSVRASN